MTVAAPEVQKTWERSAPICVVQGSQEGGRPGTGGPMNLRAQGGGKRRGRQHGTAACCSAIPDAARQPCRHVHCLPRVCLRAWHAGVAPGAARQRASTCRSPSEPTWTRRRGRPCTRGSRRWCPPARPGPWTCHLRAAGHRVCWTHACARLQQGCPGRQGALDMEGTSCLTAANSSASEGAICAGRGAAGQPWPAQARTSPGRPRTAAELAARRCWLCVAAGSALLRRVTDAGTCACACLREI